MKLGSLKPAVFVSRLNRFVCEVVVNGKIYTALLRNTGRLRELLFEGNEVYVRRKVSGKHPYEIVLARYGKELVCVDSHLPPKLLSEHLERSQYPWEPREVRFEFAVGKSRFDLLINQSILVETKSVNLVSDRTALFPDAPTERGRRHVEELISLRDRFKPALVFVVQREDADSFSPHTQVDPDFGRMVERFVEEGLPVHAFLCRVNLTDIEIWKEIPVSIK